MLTQNGDLICSLFGGMVSGLNIQLSNRYVPYIQLHNYIIEMKAEGEKVYNAVIMSVCLVGAC
jgi:hypothetical protein